MEPLPNCKVNNSHSRAICCTALVAVTSPTWRRACETGSACPNPMQAGWLDQAPRHQFWLGFQVATNTTFKMLTFQSLSLYHKDWKTLWTYSAYPVTKIPILFAIGQSAFVFPQLWMFKFFNCLWSRPKSGGIMDLFNASLRLPGKHAHITLLGVVTLLLRHSLELW